jgi:epoxyqueuosine reductase
VNENQHILADLNQQIIAWGLELGFQQVGITDIDLSQAEARLERWLAAGYHGEMEYMARHGTRRSRPAELIAGTCSVISTRMDYLPMDHPELTAVLDSDDLGYIARFALGRDYHKILRRRLQKLADRITTAIGPFGYRAFVDSAPVLEKPLAEKAGLGWIGKHTNVINKNAGSWFLLGEIYTDLPLKPVTKPTPSTNHCGTCHVCLEVCPTDAIIAPYQLDARRCISYLTIELNGPIPVEFRRAIGNRIFGCDDCQLYCPWNKFAHLTTEPDFAPRHNLDATNLITLFAWSHEEWETKTIGSPLRRPGYTGWLRNIAVALGNTTTSPAVITALTARRDDTSNIVREHVQWALEQHGQ